MTKPPPPILDPRKLPAHHRTVRFFVELVRFGARQLARHSAPQMAAALAYRTIFSLIPLLVLSLIVVKSVAGENNIRYGLRKAMEYTGISQLEVADGGPETPAVEGSAPDAAGDDSRSTKLSEHIEIFVNRTVNRLQSINFGLITVVGVVVLIYAAFSLLIQIEESFNIVYRAPSGRRWIVRLKNYWVLVTAGSLAIFFGFAISDRSAELLQTLPDSAWWIVRPLDLVLKVGLTWLILLGAYRLMPNARVPLGPAAVGAIIAAALWETGKLSLGRFVAEMTGPASAQFAVYGTIALVPLFFLWIYITWLIVLFGLEVAFALHMVSTGGAAALERLDSRSIVEPGVAVILMGVVAERFAEGKTSSTAEVAERTGLAEVTVERLLGHLAVKGYLHRVERSADDDAYALAKPPEQISAAEILTAMHDLAGGLAGPDSQTSQRDSAMLDALRKAEVAALAPFSLASLRNR